MVRTLKWSCARRRVDAGADVAGDYDADADDFAVDFDAVAGDCDAGADTVDMVAAAAVVAAAAAAAAAAAVVVVVVVAAAVASSDCKSEKKTGCTIISHSVSLNSYTGIQDA